MRWFRKKRVYMDYASAPPVSEVALRAMRDAEKYVGNPGAIHAEGAAALDALTHARNKIAALLSVKGREIVFTSGLTEANNLALLGFARALERKHRTLARTHWLVSAIEHTSVLDCFGEIERLGGSVTFVNPDSKGRVLPDAVKRALRKEIRAVLDAHERECGTKVLLHSDAGQAPLYAPSTAHSLGVDMLSVGANKLYGPHGVGALYLSNRADIVRVAHGGPQERRLRPGTESVALALGFAAAYEEVANERESEVRRLRNIRDSMVKQLCERVPGLVINGDLEYALPHMFNVSIQGIQSEYITLVLDRAGIAVSTKSACREGEESESHVVAALGGEPWRARNTLRFSLGRDTTVRDAQKAVDALEVAVNSHTA
jgi:cysteine desulfurase